MADYLSKKQAKKAILDIGKRMYKAGFVAANDGNISVKIGDNEIITTPTGVSKGYMTKECLVHLDMDGKVLKGNCKPSSEIKMHLRAYKENPFIKAVVHAHPLVSTAFGIAGEELDSPILAEAVLSLGNVPILPYATLGTEEIPAQIAPYCNSHNGVILANHGVVTWGSDPYGAYYRLESIEYYAKMTLITRFIIGKENTLSKDEIMKLLKMREKFGIHLGGMPSVDK